MKKKVLISFLLRLFFGTGPYCFAQTHPNLILTKAGVEKIRKNLETVPLFDEVLATIQAEVAAEIKIGVQVPIPKDMRAVIPLSATNKNFLFYKKRVTFIKLFKGEKERTRLLRQLSNLTEQTIPCRRYHSTLLPV